MNRLSVLRLNLGIAVDALRTHRLRSALTALGIILGVASVALVLALGRAAERQVMDSVASLGTNMLIVWPIADSGRGGRMGGTPGRLTERDALMLAQSGLGVRAVAPQLRVAARAVAEGRNTETSVIGIDAGYGEITALAVAEGRPLDERDFVAAGRVAVLGPTVAQALFGERSAVGQQVRFNRVPLTVVGVAATRGGSMLGDQDNFVLAPLDTVRRRLARRADTAPDALDMVFVGMEDGVALADASDSVADALRERNRVREGETDPFTIATTEEFEQQSRQILAVMQGVLAAIAAISLVVGGVGILNIMLVSVTERTREIGIRLAIGARPSIIRQQFLIESMALAGGGGLAGLSLAGLVCLLINLATGWGAGFSPAAAFLIFAFAAGIGLVAGYLPARRAAALQPAEALLR